MDQQTLLSLPVAEQVAWWNAEADRDPSLRDDPSFVSALEALDQILEANPLQGFAPHRCRACRRYEAQGCSEHRTPQLDFLNARTKIIAALAGNQFGKTTSLVIRAGVECLPEELVPKHLRQFKTYPGPTYGWILCPTEEKIYDSLLPTFREWLPTAGYLGGKFDKAWNGSRLMLTFANGSTINFKTYKQHESTLGGARLHWVGYDEPPPRKHRDEAMTRLLRYGGYEMFAMTPLETNTGWIKRDIYKRREAPEITVVKASMHDNPTLDEATKRHILSEYENDMWRAARENGEFVDMGGLIYSDFERIVRPVPDGDLVRSLDPCVGIDPGIRNAAFLFGGFDKEDTLGVFDELLLQDATVEDYAAGIKERLARWGIPLEKVDFVIDPAARSRTQVNAESVESALARLGIFCSHGQNSVEPGVQQIRSRIQHRRLWVSEELVRLRDEADDYAMEDRDDGEFRPIKTALMHLLDALRYMAMHRPYDHFEESQAAAPKLGWVPGHALPASALRLPAASPPLGSMS